MKAYTMLPLALALSLALFATACNRDTDDTLVDEPAVATAPVDPEPIAPAPEPVSAPADSGMSFAEMDANGDGAITEDELAETEMLFQHFSVADSNGDGQLSPEEVNEHRAAMAGSPAS